MKKLPLFIIASCGLSTIAFAQMRNIPGTVTDEEHLSLAGVSVRSHNAQLTATNQDGQFSIPTKEHDALDSSFIDYKKESLALNPNDQDGAVTLDDEATHNKRPPLTAITYNSTWVGATLFYNFGGGNSADNVIGSAKVLLQTTNQFNGTKFGLNIIGNIAKVTSDGGTDQLKQSVLAISQSSQGLSAGFEGTYDLVNNKVDCFLTLYSDLLYKFNDFTNVGDSKTDIGLSQGRFSVGIQYEGIPFGEQNDLIHFGIEGGINFFDSNNYAKVFNNKNSSLANLEATFIFPIATRMGILLNQTFTQRSSPVFSAGIVIKSMKTASR